MIKRIEYLQKIRPFYGVKLVKILTGVRRSGKSVILKQIQEELLAKGVKQSNILYYNFEDLRNYSLRQAVSLHEKILKQAESLTGKVYIFIDEIQMVEKWEECVNSLRVVLDSDIYITGSNANLLSDEFATLLSGRYIRFTIYPFSFKEFVQAYKLVTDETDERKCFYKYLLFGGMPELFDINYEEEVATKYLQELFSAIELKDIVLRYQIRDVSYLERLLLYITATPGQPFSALSISKYLKNEGFKITSPTVMNYIYYAVNAYLLYSVQKEDIKGKQLLATQEKYYIFDHGMREAVIGSNIKDINVVLENIVLLELLRRDYKVTVGNNGNKEIDFIARKKDKATLYIQVTYKMEGEKTIDREFGAFEGLRVPNSTFLVLSLDDFNLTQANVKHINLIEFLLSSSW